MIEVTFGRSGGLRRVERVSWNMTPDEARQLATFIRENTPATDIARHDADALWLAADDIDPKDEVDPDGEWDPACEAAGDYRPDRGPRP